MLAVVLSLLYTFCWQKNFGNEFLEPKAYKDNISSYYSDSCCFVLNAR